MTYELCVCRPPEALPVFKRCMTRPSGAFALTT